MNQEIYDKRLNSHWVKSTRVWRVTAWNQSGNLLFVHDYESYENAKEVYDSMVFGQQLVIL